MGTRVKAIAAGFYNGQRIRPGTEFTLADGVKPGKWLTVLQSDVAAPTKAQAAADAKAKKQADAKATADKIAKDNAVNRNIAPPADDLA